MNNNQTTQTPRELLPPAQPDHSASPEWSYQAPLALEYDPQWMVPQSLLLPPPEQSAFYTNYDQWHGQQHQYQQHVPSPVTQPPPHPATQPVYSPYQPITGYPQCYIPQPVASPQPQLPYYHHLQLQQQQQQSMHQTPPPQDLRPAKRQRFDGHNLNRQAYHRTPQPPQPQFQPLPPPAQNTWVYPGQSQGSGHGARGRSMSGNGGEIADSGRIGSHMDSDGGDRRAGQSDGGVGAASIQEAEGRNAIPTSDEPAAVPVVTQLHGAHGFSISGNPWFASIGTYTGTTVNNYGVTHGLEDLKGSVSFAALHDSAEQDPDRRCHPGTRETVLRRLRDWFDNPNPIDRIIWLHGPAGAGKSAIAQTIADEYKERGVAATFFFFRSDPSRNDGNRLFPTIAWQLAFSIPPTKDFIIDALNKTPHLPTQGIEPQFEQLVAHPFQPTSNIASQMSHQAPVVIIDGVDECSDEKLQQRFLAVIGNAVETHRVPLRFLIVSRPEALIEETLNKWDFTLSIDLAELNDSNRDIQKYLEDKFFEIASNRGLDPTWLGQDIIEEMVFKSSGNFIFASVVIRFISDEDYDPEFLLNIVQNLIPHGNMSPFALLDELFLEILRRQRDQDFLKTFLALLVARNFVRQDNLYKDDATLMNVSEKDLHIRLRRMRSLLKFEPFIDVYHKSFLDFLQDSAHSGQYHVSKYCAQKRYLELIVDAVVRHVSMAIGQPNYSGFRSIARQYPPKIALSVEDWQEALKPLLDLQDKLLKMSKPQSCRVTQVMRDLLLYLIILQGESRSSTTAQAPQSNMKEMVTKRSRTVVTKARKSRFKMDLDSCLSVLLSCLQKTNSAMVVNREITDLMFSLLAFDSVEIVARVRTVSDAQKLIDLIDLLTNNECFLSQCGPDAARKAAFLASDIFASVPLLPQSLFSNKPGCYVSPPNLSLFELECQTAFISRILDHNYIIPVIAICNGGDRLALARSDKNEQEKSVYEWLRRSSPNLVERIRVILEVARTIRYIHSMDVVLWSDCIQSKHFFLNSNLRAKFKFIGLFAWWSREAAVYHHEYAFLTDHTYESNISAFARLFYEACFKDHHENLSNPLVKDALQLIERCCTKDLKNQPTMEDVVTKMETWNLIKTAYSP